MRLQFYRISAIISDNSASQCASQRGSENLNFPREHASDPSILFDPQQLKAIDKTANAS